MDCKVIVIFLFVGGMFSTSVGCFHILGMPSPGISHGRVMIKLGRELARRGYKFTQVVTKWEENYHKPSTKIPNFEVKSYETQYKQEDVEALFKNMIIDEMLDLTQFDKIWGTTCEDLLNNKAYFETIGRVDLVVCDLVALCCTIVADMLNVTRVDLVTMGFNEPFISIIHQFTSPAAYVPQLFVSFPTKMSFMDRTKNAALYLAAYITHHFVYIPRYRRLKKEFAPNSPYKDWETLAKSTGLVLVQTDFSLMVSRPSPPFVKVVGAIIPEEPNALPQNFLDAMATGSDVIIASMGTIITKFDESIVDILATAFARLPALVIWKHKGKPPSRLGNNTLLFPWIPQNDLLGHPKVKLFVSHCGMNSMLEAAYHGKPVVAIPVFADQFINAQSLKDTGMAEVVKYNNLNSDDLTAAILKVLNAKSYRENAKRVSKKMELPGCGATASRPAGCVKLAADWVEYGIKNDGALHFRTEMDNLSFIQLYLLDVMFLMVVIFVALAFALVFTCKCVFRICKRKPKTE